jgi:hypothetical protein
MPIEDYEIVGSYNNQRFPNIDAERTINMFEYIDAKGKKPKCLISTSGLQNTGLIFPSAAPTDGFRMEFVLNQFEYFVVGPHFYRRDSLNNVVQLNDPGGTQPILGTGYVGVDANNNANGSQILFVDGQKGHIWDTGTDIFTYDVKLVDPAFPDVPIDVTFLDGLLVVAHGATNQFQLSGLNDAYSWGLVSNTFIADSVTDKLTVSTIIPTGTQIDFIAGGGLPAPLVAGTIYFAINVDATHIRVATTYANALANVFINLTTNGTPPNTIRNLTNGIPGQLQLGTINTHPGNIVACRTLHRRLFLFSANFTEVWENQGIGTNLPFRRNNALLMEYGTPAIGSIVTGFDKMMFLSQDRDGLGAVMEVIGTESIPISNRALDFQLSQYAEANQVSDARGIFVKENGIIFYRLNFTAANHTFVYNVTLSNPLQEEGKLWHEEQVLNGNRHPAQTHGYFNGNNYYGSYNQPILYQVDQAFTSNDGEAIPRIRIGRCYVPSTYNRTRIDRWMLDAIQGQTDITNLTNILDLLTETGMPIDTENGLDIILDQSTFSPIYNLAQPPVFLSYSKDGGVTFGNRQVAFLGAIADRKHRTVWRKLGVVPRGQGFVPKIKFFSNVPFIILGAAWFFEVLPQ